MSGSYLIGCPFLDREYKTIDLRKWEQRNYTNWENSDP